MYWHALLSIAVEVVSVARFLFLILTSMALLVVYVKTLRVVALRGKKSILDELRAEASCRMCLSQDNHRKPPSQARNSRLQYMHTKGPVFDFQQ